MYCFTSKINNNHIHIPKTSIVFVHNKKSSYMSPVLDQARLSNPDANIYIISNESSRKFYERYGIFIDISKHFNEADEFEKIYVHLSSLSYSIELIFIQRWFILKSFMLSYNIGKIVYLDSDCMLYHDVNADWHLFTDYDFANLDLIWPAVTYIPTVDSLIKFCNFLNDQYTRNLDFIITKYKRNFQDKDIQGGIGDMSHFGMYFTKYKSIFDLSGIIQESTYDTNINDSVNTRINLADNEILVNNTSEYILDYENNIKKISISGNLPFGLLKKTNKKIRFKSLHFQGSSKKYIPYFYTGSLLKKWIYIRRFKKLGYT
jgi:hypothetical protein